jgi:MoxR-like ATPase
MTAAPSVQGRDALLAAAARLRAEVQRRIVGQEGVLDEILMSLIAGGHALLVGVPGLAKTLMVRSLAEAVHLDFRRIQFTPDLVPSDITGTEILEEDSATGARSFRFVRGPSFAHIVLATQNPIEQEGTYPLPEAQLDRFLFDIRVGYPKEEEEIAILRDTTGAKQERLGTILGAHELIALQVLARDIAATDSVLRYAATLVRATRPDDGRAPELVKRYVRWGAGPRAGQSLILGAKANALLAGRLAASPADVKRVALPVLRHRVLPNFAAEAEGMNVERIIDDLLARIEPARSEIHV